MRYSVIANWPNGLILKQEHKGKVVYVDIRDEDVDSICTLLMKGKKENEEIDKGYNEWLDEQGDDKDGPPVGAEEWD